MNKPIPFIDLAAQQQRIGKRLNDAIARVLAHGSYILGPEVAELEKQLAAFCGAKYCVTCASGTDAILLPLMAQGIGPGDAVFVPSFTFAATAEVVALLGATPVFVDIDPDSFNVDPASLAKAIPAAKAQNLKLRTVMPVDLFGLPADYDAIASIAADHGMTVVADAAQSFGAVYHGRKSGTIGLATGTSFFPAKPLGCYGDGGATFTDDKTLADTMASLRFHGKGEDKYDNVRIGINGRLDTLQAAILIEKLAIFADELDARQRVADRYTSALHNMVATPVVPAHARSAWAQYTVKLNGRDRSKIANALKAKGIPTAVYYPRPLHQQTAYKKFPCVPGGLPVSEKLADDVISLPMHPYLDAATQDMIIEQFSAALTSA
ncbi:MAG: DegT/DnrJ/EryC1/StrS aminotransferase family protein [Rhodobacteraceae bacterium]|nr:DegT/DnrJ/EryC1/StrS aminotransferase family protein [Paracoccaceae bacterium]